MEKRPVPGSESQPRLSTNLSDLQIDWKDDGTSDIVSSILHDHIPLKDLIPTLKSDELDRAGKEGALEKFVSLLTIHAKSEEQTLYVQMKARPALREEGFEGATEHGIATQLMREINGAADDDEWCAKTKILAELVEKHIKEEEDVFLEDVKEHMSVAVRASLAMDYARFKNELDMLFRKVPGRGGVELNLRLN